MHHENEGAAEALMTHAKQCMLKTTEEHGALIGADAKDADDLVELVGDYTARSFYSRVWQLREAALLRMQRLLEVGVLLLHNCSPLAAQLECFRTVSHHPFGAQIQISPLNVFTTNSKEQGHACCSP